MSKIIRGSKGRQAPREPVRAEDTLNSKEFATIQDLLSEGEIEGFATPSEKGIARNNANYNNACLADIFLDDTPVLNVSPDDTNFTTKLNNLTDTDFSFEDVTFIPRFGEGNQKPVANLENANLQKTSNTILTNSAVVTTTSFVDSPPITTDPIKHAVEVTIQFLALQKFETNGDILGTEVNYQIQLQTNNGTFTTIVDETITGRSKDSYSREHTINLPTDTYGNANYTQAKIRVKRITADSDPDVIQDTFGVSRMEEVVYTPQSYPDCAYSTLRVSSEQFSSVPQRAFRIRGIKVKIPGAGANNSGTPTVVKNQADADALGLGTVSSFGFIHYPAGYIFNGTMGAAQWCTCPAMILLDLLTNQRYGLGVHISPDQSTDAKTYESIDLFSYVQASRYANEEVTLEDGTKEARFACNVAIQGTAEAYTLINELAGVMRAFPIWQTGSITLTQDRPTDPSFLFSLANVTEAGFSYSGSSLKQRHSVISVRYFNMDSREIDYEVFEDTAAVAKLGIIKKTVQAFGCTSRTQAIRLAKAILFSEQNESEIVSFSTSIDAGAIVRPGSVISINDPVRSVERRSGRVKSVATIGGVSVITVDSSQDLSTFQGSNKTLSVMLPDGKVETKTLAPGNSITNNVITLSSALSQTPSVNAVWILSSSGTGGVEPQTFRVISVEEQDGVNYAITALTYIPGKYANIEEGVPLPVRNLSLLNQPKSPPSGLVAEERIIVKNKLAIVKLILSWVAVTGVSQYQVQYRFNNANWVVQDVFRPDFEIEGTEAGTYEFRVFSYNAALKISETSTDLTFNAVGKNAPPGNVQNLQMEPVDAKNVRLKWDQAVDPDVLHGGRVYVRHSSVTDGTGTFNNAVDLVEALPGNSTEQIVPALEGEYILRFQDDQGNFSTGSASVLVDLPDILDTQIILSDGSRQDTLSSPYSGRKVETRVVNNTLRLRENTGITLGTYFFQDGAGGLGATFDLGRVYSLDLKRFIKSVGFQVQRSLETFQQAYVNQTSSSAAVPNPGPSGRTIPALTIEIRVGAGHLLSVGDPVQIIIGSGGNPLDGIYTVSEVLDANFFRVTLSSAVGGLPTFLYTSGSFQKQTFLDQLIPAGSFWDDYATDGNFDGTSADTVNCKMLVASTDIDPAYSSPNYTNGTSFSYVQDDGSEDGTTPGTVITATSTGHGLKVGDNIRASFGTSNNTNTFYTVQTVPDANKFTLTSNGTQAISNTTNNAFLKFTKFAALSNGTFKGRAFAFKLELTTEKPLVENIEVQQAGVVALFPARTENSYKETVAGSEVIKMAAQQSGTSQKNITFARPFFTGVAGLGGLNSFKPNVGVTVENLLSGEYVTLSNITGTGFTILIRDSSNTPVDRRFTFTAVGYGKGV